MGKLATFFRNLHRRVPVTRRYLLPAAVALAFIATVIWIGAWATVAILTVVWFWPKEASGQALLESEKTDPDNLPQATSQQELNDWLSNPAYSHLPSNAYHHDT